MKNGGSIWMRILWIPIILCDLYNYISNLYPVDLRIKFVFPWFLQVSGYLLYFCADKYIQRYGDRR